MRKEKTLTRRRGDRWCRIEVALEGDQLSICGSEGRVLKRAAAKKEALEYWRNFFDDNPDELIEMNKRCGKRFTSATGAARFVLKSDGELHGLDVTGPETGSEVYITESGGQIRETLAEWFPEVVPYLKWHLNDMNAACEHQEAEGWAERPIDPSKPLNTYGRHFPGQQHDSWNMLAWVRPEEHKGGLLGAPCPVCGYKYGTAWLKREFPAEVRAWAEGFPGSMANGAEARL
jgi:hypothetical protein